MGGPYPAEGGALVDTHFLMNDYGYNCFVTSMAEGWREKYLREVGRLPQQVQHPAPRSRKKDNTAADV